MDSDEPKPRDLVDGVFDTFLSNRLVDVILRKWGFRSYHEFFNRVIGIGFILTALGLLSVAVAWLTGSETRLQLFGISFRNAALLSLVIVGAWLFPVFVREVNLGRGIDEHLARALNHYVSPNESFRRTLFAEILSTVLYGGILFLILSEFDTRSGFIDTLQFVLLLAIIFGIILLIAGYFFRSLFRVGSLLRAEYGGSGDTGDDHSEAQSPEID